MGSEMCIRDRRSPWLIVGIILGITFVVTAAPFALGIFSVLFLR